MRLPAILSVYAASLPLVSLLAPKGTVPLLVLATLIGGAAAWREGRRPVWPCRGLLAATLLFLAWSLASAWWSLDAEATLVTGAKTGAVVLLGFAFFALAAGLHDAERRRVLRWLIAGVLATFAVIVFEYAFGYPLYRLIVGAERAAQMDAGHLLPVRYNRGISLLAILIWPALAALRQGSRLRGILLFAAIVAALAVSESFAAVVALFGGAVTWALSRGAPRVARALVIAAPVVAMIGSPIAAKALYAAGLHESDWMFGNAQHRVEIWNLASDIIAGRPLQGWGLDAARAVSRLQPISETSQRALMPSHPHNAALQVLLELGAVGAAIVLGFVLLAAWRVNRAPPDVRPKVQALFVGLLIVSMISFGLWQAHWLATIAGVAALAGLMLPASGAGQQGQVPRGGGDRAGA